MNKYKVQINYQGYVRGYKTIEVEADSEEEAKENWDAGVELENEIVRDDTETTYIEVESPKPAPVTAIERIRNLINKKI